MGYRYARGASKELTEVMRKPIKESDSVTWDTVELLMPGTQLTVWSRKDGTSIPDLHEEHDPDDIYPESEVTKQFWKNLFSGIERWKNEKKLI